MNEELKEIKALPKSGEEELTFDNQKLGYYLLDFWKWSVSDILSNATRGKFAEFIVGTAIDLDFESVRNEWDAFDLITSDGIKIEVKSAAYIQSWSQKDYSSISFSIKSARFWDAENNMQKAEPKRHADVYVFCLLKHKAQETVDPLKLEQWEFYVLPTSKLDSYQRSQTSITLNSLKKLTDGITYQNLKTRIYNAKYT